VLGVHYLEETYNKGYGGSRFLLEMDVQLQNGVVHTSEYIYLPKNGTNFCKLAEYKWKKNVNVALIVTSKYLISYIYNVYSKTSDKDPPR
jgi:hypothetical protein